MRLMMLFNNLKEVESKEFNWSKYKQDTINRFVKKFGSLEQTIIVLDAEIQSLKVTNSALQEMIDWDDESMQMNG
jgi:hypothetical protein